MRPRRSSPVAGPDRVEQARPNGSDTPTPPARHLLLALHQASARVHDEVAASHEWAAAVAEAAHMDQIGALHRRAAASDRELAAVERALADSFQDGVEP